MQITFGWFCAILILLNAGFITWCIVDIKNFQKKGRKQVDEFDAFCKKAVDAAIFSSGKKVDEKLSELNDRVNILAKENIKLREQNEHYKGKLQNCGFTDIDLDF